MKRLEQKMDGDRANVYDHIDASHRTLGDRIDHLDRRAAQQIYALDKLTRERIRLREARHAGPDGKAIPQGATRIR